MNIPPAHMNDGGVAETDVDRRLSDHSVKRGVERLESIFTRFFRPRLHIGLVDLHDIGAGCKQILDFVVHRGGVVERHLLLVFVEFVLRLLRHCERARHRHFDHAVGIGAQEFYVVYLDRMPAPDFAGNARHRIGMAGAVKRGAGVVDVDTFERGGEAIGIAFASYLTVGDDVESGALLIADRKQGRIILCRFR